MSWLISVPRTAAQTFAFVAADRDDGHVGRLLAALDHEPDRRIDYVFPTFVNYSDAGLTARTEAVHFRPG